MHTNHKLIGLSLITAVLVAGCTGTGLPTGTTPDQGAPGFNVTVTKNNSPVRDTEIFLKSFNNVSEGSYANSQRLGTTAKTDGNGIAFIPADATAVASGALFGVGYDASNGAPENKSAATLNDEILWFTTPAVNLSTKTGKRHSVAIDIGWAVNGFTPANGAAVSGKTVNFTLPAKTGATEYEVVVRNGNVAGSGTPAFSDKKTSPSFTWTGASNGNYNYDGKFFTGSGVAGIQASSAALVFSVTGAQ